MTQCAILYIVPTPIDHLEDISQRALNILNSVDLIAAEDTRHTGLLLHHFHIRTRLFALHDHNEQQKTEKLVTHLQAGLTLALVCDAGTPLISDPGFYLVRRCRELGIKVVPLPGPCAAITALSAAGLATDRFCFEGFVPAKHTERCRVLTQLLQEPRTLIFYVAPHRLIDTLQDMVVVLGAERQGVLARELTKRWEEIHSAALAELLLWVQQDAWRCRGEMVLIVAGYQTDHNELALAACNTLKLLMTALPLKQAAALTAQIHNSNKNALYRYGLQWVKQRVERVDSAVEKRFGLDLLE